MLAFSIFLFFSENGPLSSRTNFSVSHYLSAPIFHQSREERIIDQFQSTKYWCEPHVSKIIGVSKQVKNPQVSIVAQYIIVILQHVNIGLWYVIAAISMHMKLNS